MDEARSRTRGTIYTADAFAALPSGQRQTLRETLVCTACGADAYFIREARNGRRACFGARPHEEGCELASIATEDGGSGALDEVDEQINAGDIFRIEPARVRLVRHARHDPLEADRREGAAVRYTGRGRGGRRTSSMGIDRLLRQLVLRESFRDSRTMLILSDDTQHSVRKGCVHIHDIEDNHLNKLRVYWGVIRFPRPKPGGGAWLNTGSRLTPSLVIEEDDLLSLLDRKGMSDLEDLSGSYFAIMGRLRQGPSGKRLLWVDDLDWFGVRPYDEDEHIN